MDRAFYSDLNLDFLQAGEGSLGDPTALVSAVASAALRGRAKGPVSLFPGATDGLASPPGAPAPSPFEQATHLLHGTHFCRLHWERNAVKCSTICVHNEQVWCMEMATVICCE